MRVNELVRKSVVFLGIVDPAGAFAPYGTAFTALWKERDSDDFSFWYLITAKHVVDDMRATGRPMVARLNTLAGGVALGKLSPEEWRTHGTNHGCDIAVAGFNASRDTFDYRFTNLNISVVTQRYIEKNDIGCGDPVYTVGLLVRHFGVSRNIPVVRIGNIAATPEEPIDLGSNLGSQDVYLIESRSIGGLSGSPVFLQTPPWRIVNQEMVSAEGDFREYLIGVNIGLFEAPPRNDVLPRDTADRREQFLEMMSAGIAVVVPIERALEIIRDDPVLKGGRDMARAKREKKSGFIPTSAAVPKRDDYGAPEIPIVSLASDENPTHREDFNSLLQQAAQTKPQDD